MKYLILLISISLNAQLQNDWDATIILSNMDKSWSVGNGCLEANYKVVNTNGLELNGNTLEIMDARIQVMGELTNFGEQIEPTHELINYACTTSELVVYNETLGIEEYQEEEQQLKIRIYPNPTKQVLNIQTEQLDCYEIYNLSGQLIQKGLTKTIYVNHLESGMYFLILHIKEQVVTIKFIKND